MSSLSISKLEQLLTSKGFTPKRYFIIHKYCAFIEVVNTNTSSTFMLSIPSKYKFKLKENDYVFNLKIIDIESDNLPAEDYAKEPDNLEMEKKYVEVELTNKLLRNNENIEGNISGYLEEGYKRNISLKELTKEDKSDIKDIVRQVKRLKYCVQSIGYKLVIFYINYLCVLDRDDSIECFFIKKMNKINSRRLLISIDLELFYENMNRLEQDISDVENGIYRVFDKNQENHIKNLSKLLEEQIHITQYTKNIILKRKEYSDYINKFNSLLTHLNISENSLLEKNDNLNLDHSKSNIYTNAGMIHKKSKIEDDLNDLNNVKSNILKNIKDIKNRQEDMLLKVDKIMFDNLVMMASIMKNIDTLKIYSQ
jgi:hypothetical protein